MGRLRMQATFEGNLAQPVRGLSVPDRFVEQEQDYRQCTSDKHPCHHHNQQHTQFALAHVRW